MVAPECLRNVCATAISDSQTDIEIAKLVCVWRLRDDLSSSCWAKVLYLMGIPILSADYYDTPYYTEYECSFPLLDHAVLTATSALRERGPQNARLNGKYRLFSIVYTHNTVSHMLRARTQ